MHKTNNGYIVKYSICFPSRWEKNVVLSVGHLTNILLKTIIEMLKIPSHVCMPSFLYCLTQHLFRLFKYNWDSGKKTFIKMIYRLSQTYTKEQNFITYSSSPLWPFIKINFIHLIHFILSSIFIIINLMYTHSWIIN